jgi:hypothetical protein
MEIEPIVGWAQYQLDVFLQCMQIGLLMALVLAVTRGSRGF